MPGKERRKKRTPAEILADLKAEVASMELTVQMDLATETGPLKDLAYDRRTILEDGKAAQTALSVDEGKPTSFSYRVAGHLAWVSIWKAEQALCESRVACSEKYLPLVTDHLQASVAFSVDHTEEELEEFISDGMGEILGDEYSDIMADIEAQGQIVQAMRAARKAAHFSAVVSLEASGTESSYFDTYFQSDEEAPEDDSEDDSDDDSEEDED